jgi:hypothetical protein
MGATYAPLTSHWISLIGHLEPHVDLTDESAVGFAFWTDDIFLQSWSCELVHEPHPHPGHNLQPRTTQSNRPRTLKKAISHAKISSSLTTRREKKSRGNLILSPCLRRRQAASRSRCCLFFHINASRLPSAPNPRP